jgi:hypothetical protein
MNEHKSEIRIIGVDIRAPDLARNNSSTELAQGRSTQRINEGGIVMVRVNGAFLGSSWVVRGEKGWDETTPYPPPGVELGRGIVTRKIPRKAPLTLTMTMPPSLIRCVLLPCARVQSDPAYTREGRKWPEVVSSQVEAWLKTEGDLTRVVAREVYAGSDWTFSSSFLFLALLVWPRLASSTAASIRGRLSLGV